MKIERICWEKSSGLHYNLRQLTHIYLILTKNAPSNKTQALTKIISMGIWVIGTLKQLFIRGSYT